MPPQTVWVANEHATSEDNDYLLAVFEKLNKLGMDAYAQDVPDPSASSEVYHKDHRELERFWGILLTEHSTEQDVETRYRLASLLIHPDKHAAATSGVQASLGGLQAKINQGKVEMIQRIKWIKARKIAAPRAGKTLDFWTPFQELHPDLQLHLLERFGIVTPGHHFAHHSPPARYIACTA